MTNIHTHTASQSSSRPDQPTASPNGRWALVLGVPRYLIRMLLAGGVRYLRVMPFPRQRFAARWELNYLLGSAREARRHFRGR